jgi:hypothetical protein
LLEEEEVLQGGGRRISFLAKTSVHSWWLVAVFSL